MAKAPHNPWRPGSPARILLASFLGFLIAGTIDFVQDHHSYSHAVLWGFVAAIINGTIILVGGRSRRFSAERRDRDAPADGVRSGLTDQRAPGAVTPAIYGRVRDRHAPVDAGQHGP